MTERRQRKGERGSGSCPAAQETNQMRNEGAKSIKDERQTQRKTSKAIIKRNLRERVIADVTACVKQMCRLG